MSMTLNSDSTHAALSVFEDLESEVRGYGRVFPTVFRRAQGCRLFDTEDREYLDFLMGCSSLNYGHNPVELKSALVDYISADGITHSLDMYSEAKARFMSAFDTFILKPRGLDYVMQFPGPTGANAVEAALKLARKVTGRENVIAFTNGFHGVTAGALACTGNEHHRGAAGITLSGVTRMPYEGYLDGELDTSAYLDQVLSDPSSGVDAPAAVIFETVQGEGGLNAASYEWQRKIAAVARKHGALLIVDDIQAGIGRTGTFFSFEPSRIQPDIITMAKSLSGYGLPMAMVLIDPRFDEWSPGEHNGTFRGNCHAFVTAYTAIREFWRNDEFELTVAAHGKTLETRLNGIANQYGPGQIAVKGRGMMQGLQMKSGDLAADVVQYAFENGLVIETSGPNDEVVKCLAPLNISEEDLGRGLDILEAAVESIMRKALKSAA